MLSSFLSEFTDLMNIYRIFDLTEMFLKCELVFVEKCVINDIGLI
jgi:hypothetical protein